MHLTEANRDPHGTASAHTAGIPVSFRTSLVEHIPRLHRYARALLAGNADAADDLIQETLTRALEKAHLWQPGSDMRAWLFTLLHNQFVNTVRLSARRGKQVGLDTPSELDAIRLSRPAGQSDALLMRDLQRALGQLHPLQREALLLAALEGLSYEDIAELLEVPVGTVRSRISRARETLRQLMDAPERASHTAKLREAAAARRVLRTDNGHHEQPAIGEIQTP
jgi:RNA polymerase sigma-70 factor, ECF subfamily